MKFNLSTRIELFAICTSIEIDIKKYIMEATGEIPFTQAMRSKARQRMKGMELYENSQILDQLDLGDYGDLIIQNPDEFQLNPDKVKILKTYLDKVIPIRNRVMHTKPLELGDRATLFEVLERIARDIDWIPWNEVLHTKYILETDPSQLNHKTIITRREDSPRVYHNLPAAEFDDTGYIGREKSVKEIKDLLCNHKNQIVTVVGNGGIGKTAIAVKVLYDLIDDPKCEFEYILWITLHTPTLSNAEFAEIQDCIAFIQERYDLTQNNMTGKDDLTPEQKLLSFMTHFKTLMVLDHLQTLNISEMNDFLSMIPEQSKVLITSRHGLGELEKRVYLDGLAPKDCVTYFRELSKYYGLDMHRRSDQEIIELAQRKLFANPLSIKWYMHAIYNGTDEKKIMEHKEDLIDFCISNLYENLSDIAKRISHIFLLQKKHMSYGALDFYMNLDEVTLKTALNELLAIHMLEGKNGEFTLNEMFREYIAFHEPPEKELVVQVSNKRKMLQSMTWQMKRFSLQEPFNPKSIITGAQSEDEQFATYYLQNALLSGREKKWDEAKGLCEKAACICPNYFEVYKIQAVICAQMGDLYGAICHYEIAFGKCKTNRERAIICYLFSKFYSVKMQNFDYAKEYIDKADAYLPDREEIVLEKARVSIFSGEFEEAERLLEYVEGKVKHPALRTQNVMASIWGELCRRRVETVGERDYLKKVESYQFALEKFDRVEKLDIKSGVVLLSLLNDMTYCLYDQETIQLMILTLEKYSRILSRVKNYKKQKMCQHLLHMEEKLDEQSLLRIKCILNENTLMYDEISAPNEGIVTAVKEHYGFISNRNNKGSNAIYFSCNNAYPEIQVGDAVSFELLQTVKGVAARRVKKKSLR